MVKIRTTFLVVVTTLPVGQVDVLQDEAYARLLLGDVLQCVHPVLDEARAGSVKVQFLGRTENVTFLLGIVDLPTEQLKTNN